MPLRALALRPPGSRSTTDYDRSRGSAHSRGYDRAWVKLRTWWIKRNPLCAECEREGKLTVATEVDHMVPISRDRSRRLDPDNLQSLCHPCHVAKTARDKGIGGL
jgi:5-methylcytosine-specific restriction enzyme A